jgi:hypothetical protein
VERRGSDTGDSSTAAVEESCDPEPGDFLSHNRPSDVVPVDQSERGSPFEAAVEQHACSCAVVVAGDRDDVAPSALSCDSSEHPRLASGVQFLGLWAEHFDRRCGPASSGDEWFLRPERNDQRARHALIDQLESKFEAVRFAGEDQHGVCLDWCNVEVGVANHSNEWEHGDCCGEE